MCRDRSQTDIYATPSLLIQSISPSTLRVSAVVKAQGCEAAGDPPTAKLTKDVLDGAVIQAVVTSASSRRGEMWMFRVKPARRLNAAADRCSTHGDKECSHWAGSKKCCNFDKNLSKQFYLFNLHSTSWKSQY